MQHPNQRSVDEILKAIQKVIEKDAQRPADEARAPEESVMLNAERPAPQEVDEVEFLVTDEDEDAGILDLGTAATALIDEEAASDPEPEPASKAKTTIPPERIIAQIEETLTSERAADAMRRSLSNLSAISETSEPPAAPAGETTIEQLVRDMLRPQLAAWLDENLPPMVERLVKDEIARIAGKRS